MEIITTSSAETEALGNKIATKLQGGEIIALCGELGSGKTTMAKGLAKALGVTEEILSPTFVILKKYHSAGKKITTLNHIDAYRLNSDWELADLGFAEISEDKHSVTLVEWADKVAKLLPPATIKISFFYLGDDKRKILIKNLKKDII